MSNAVFPDQMKGLAFTVNRTTERRTIVQTSPSLVEQRIQQAQQPVIHWTLIYEWIYNDFPSDANPKEYSPWSDYDMFDGFWEARGGQFDSFLFRDTSQRQNGLIAYVGPAITVNAVTIPPATPNDPPAGMGTPNTAGCVGYRPATLQLVQGSDGNWYSPIQIWRGGQFWEDIRDIDGTFYVYADGVLQSASGYSFVNGVVTPTFTSSALAINWGAGGSIVPWTPSTIFPLGTQVLDPIGHVQQVVGGESGDEAPTWNDSGGTTTDFALIWTDQGAGSGKPVWQAATWYAAGTEVLDSSGHIQKVTGLNGAESALTEPAWNDSGGTTEDGSLLWQDEGPNTNPPPVAGPITAQFHYFYRVRFESDSQDWEQFMQELWTIGGNEAKQGAGYLKLRSVRGGVLPPGCSLIPVVTTDGMGWTFTGEMEAREGAGGGGGGVSYSDSETPTDSGDHQQFTLANTPNPAASAIGVLEGTNYPSQVLLLGVDYTLSGASVTLSNAIDVSDGATFNLRFWYRY